MATKKPPPSTPVKRSNSLTENLTATIRSRVKGLKMIEANKLIGHEFNWRKHPTNQTNALKRIVNNVGFVAPILAIQTAKGYKIIDGHLRTGIAGNQKVPVVILDLTEAEAKKVLATIDIITDMAQEDPTKLHELVLSLSARDQKIIDEVLAETPQWKLAFNQSVENDAEPQIDRAEELLKKWKVKLGQSWQVGRHTVICGDSSTLDWNADIVVTDPPFDLLPINVMASVSRYAARAVLILGGKQAFNLLKDVPDWEYRLDFVWHHRRPRWLGTNHMPVMYHNNILVICKPKTKTGYSLSATESSSIFVTEREFVDTKMGHGKAAEVFVRMMAGFDFKKAADPFLGTGATLIACEQTRRTCFGVEKEPSTLAVALERFKKYSLSPQLTQ